MLPGHTPAAASLKCDTKAKLSCEKKRHGQQQGNAKLLKHICLMAQNLQGMEKQGAVPLIARTIESEIGG